MKKLLIIFTLIFILSGCANAPSSNVELVELTFETNGGDSISAIEVESDILNFLPTPSRDGYTFGGWFTDVELTSDASIYELRTENVTFYADWHEITASITSEEPIDLSSLPYSSYLSSENPVVIISVEGIGIFELQLFPSVAPNTVDNFISYIFKQEFDESSFHRIIETFMIQGGITGSDQCSIRGDFLANGVDNSLNHYRGVISMARTSVMNSATSQFFIVHNDSLFLDGSYATFGGLISGFNVLDYIAGVPTNAADGPLERVTISNITVELNGYVPGEPVCAN